PVHFSCPTGTHVARSLPLKSFTHCSPGYGGRLVGTWAPANTDSAITKNVATETTRPMSFTSHYRLFPRDPRVRPRPQTFGMPEQERAEQDAKIRPLSAFIFAASRRH